MQIVPPRSILFLCVRESLLLGLWGWHSPKHINCPLKISVDSGGGGGGEDNLAFMWKRGFCCLLNEVMEKFKVV